MRILFVLSKLFGQVDKLFWGLYTNGDRRFVRELIFIFVKVKQFSSATALCGTNGIDNNSSSFLTFIARCYT